METLETLLAKQVDVIKRLETFFLLQTSKADVLGELKCLREKSRESSEAVRLVKPLLEQFYTTHGPKYVEVMRKMRMNELLMLHLLEQLDKLVEVKKPVTSQIQDMGKVIKKEAATVLTVERMTLSEYQNSPFVSKMKPRCLSFLDFNVHISQAEFDQIPKYMRGRESVTELVEFLQTVIVSCFEEKYTLLYKNKKAITNQQDLALWKAFNLQQAAFPNFKFITQGDVARKLGRMIDKKINVKLQMLRHLHILQETRHEGTVYYIWIRE